MLRQSSWDRKYESVVIIKGLNKIRFIFSLVKYMETGPVDLTYKQERLIKNIKYIL